MSSMCVSDFRVYIINMKQCICMRVCKIVRNKRTLQKANGEDHLNVNIHEHEESSGRMLNLTNVKINKTGVSRPVAHLIKSNPLESCSYKVEKSDLHTTI